MADNSLPPQIFGNEPVDVIGVDLDSLFRNAVSDQDWNTALEAVESSEYVYAVVDLYQEFYDAIPPYGVVLPGLRTNVPVGLAGLLTILQFMPNLRGLRLDNSDGIYPVEQVSLCSVLMRVHSIVLQNVEASADDLDRLFVALQNLVSHHPGLETLSLLDCALRHIPLDLRSDNAGGLRTLILNNSSLHESTLRGLFEGPCSITDIQITDNLDTDGEMSTLERALSRPVQIHMRPIKAFSLVLPHNHDQEGLMDKVFHLLANNATLRTLEFSYRSWPRRHLQRLGDLIAGLPALKQLILTDYDEEVTPNSIQDGSTLLSILPGLSQCQLLEEFCFTSLGEINPAVSVRLIRALVALPRIRSIRFPGCDLNPTVFSYFAQALALAQQIQALDLGDCDAALAGSLATMIGSCPSLLSLRVGCPVATPAITAAIAANQRLVVYTGAQTATTSAILADRSRWFKYGARILTLILTDTRIPHRRRALPSELWEYILEMMVRLRL